MEFSKIISIFLFFSIFSFNGMGQTTYEIEKACIKDGVLHVTFFNPTKFMVIVPRLSDRYDLRTHAKTKERYLDEKYFEVIGDTLVITVSNEKIEGLIDPNGTRIKYPRVFYKDYSLKPMRRYRTRIKIKIPFSDIRFLKLKYEENTSTAILKSNWNNL